MSTHLCPKCGGCGWRMLKPYKAQCMTCDHIEYDDDKLQEAREAEAEINQMSFDFIDRSCSDEHDPE